MGIGIFFRFVPKSTWMRDIDGSRETDLTKMRNLLRQLQYHLGRGLMNDENGQRSFFKFSNPVSRKMRIRVDEDDTIKYGILFLIYIFK